jgi:subtilisin family serine protease
MMKQALVIVFLATLMGSLFGYQYSYLHQQETIELKLLTSELVIKFGDNISSANQESIIRKVQLNDLENVTILPNPKIALVKLKTSKSEEQINQLLSEYNKLSEVLYASPVLLYGQTKCVPKDEILIRIQERSISQINSIASRYNCIVHESIEAMQGVHVLKLNNPKSDRLFDIVGSLANEYGVEWAEPNFVLQLKPSATMPNDPYFANQWALNNTGQNGGTIGADIAAPLAWDISTGNNTVTIAIIDEGVDINHFDLSGKFVTGYDAIDGDDNQQPNTWDGHGTACAGIAAAASNNSTGVAGVAWGCRIMPIRIAYTVSSGSDWTTENTWIALGILTAVSRGADVLSNSWGGGAPSNFVTNAIQSAKANGRNGLGCVVVFASGNDNTAVQYPATLTEVIAVGATNNQDRRCSPTDWGTGQGSNFGTALDVVAPGNGIWTTDITGAGGYNSGSIADGDAAGHYYNDFGGTSAATPHVAGLAGLMLSYKPELTANEVQQIIQNTAEDQVGSTTEDIAGWDQYMGWGRINAHNALTEISPYVVNGNITMNTTWRSGHVYRVMSDVTVPLGVTLTIEAGVIVKFEYNSNTTNKRRLFVDGALVVQGTAGSPVVFTSSRDDSYGGDTDGTTNVPAAGDWGYIKLTNPNGYSLSNCIFRYGGCYYYQGTASYNNNRVLWLTASAAITNCQFQYIFGTSSNYLTEGNAVYVSNGSLTISGSSFTNCYNGVYVNGASATANSNTFTTCNNALTFTINSSDGVNGNDFTSCATAISVTTTGISEILNNTFYDCTTSVYFKNGLSESLIQGNTVNRASRSGTGITIVNSSPTVNSNNVSNVTWGIEARQETNTATVAPNITNNTISYVDYPYSQYGGPNPVYTGNILSNVSRPIVYIGGGTMYADKVFGSIQGVFYPYLIAGDYTVAAGMTLTIPSGQIVKFEYNSNTTNKRRLFVDGALVVQGTAGSPVVFTSSRDDSYGGDTDGTTNVPAAGDWGYIKLTNPNGYSLSNCIFRYGGCYYYQGTASYNNNRVLWLTASAAITNCQFQYIFGTSSNYLTEGNAVYVSNGSLTISGSSFTSCYNSICIVGSTYVPNTISNCIIANSTSRGISLSGTGTNTMIMANAIYSNQQGIYFASGTATVYNNNITNNTQYGLFNNTTTLVNAVDNWWGSIHGPLNPTSNPSGTGNPVSNNVTYYPWRTTEYYNEQSNQGMIIGTVRNAVNQNPIAGAYVTTSNNLQTTQPTGTNGYYFITDVPFGSGYNLTAYASGYQNASVGNISVSPSNPIVNVNIAMTPTGPTTAARLDPLIPSSQSISSQVQKGGTLHRYYTVIDVTSGLPRSAAQVVVQGNGNTWTFVSDSSGIVDFAIPSNNIGLPGSNSEFTVTSISGTAPAVATSFICGVLPPSAEKYWDTSTFRKAELSVIPTIDVGFKLTNGLSTKVIDNDITTVGYNYLNLQRQIQAEAGASFGVGGGLYVEVGDVYEGVNLNTEVYGSRAVITEDTYNFLPQSQGDYENWAKLLIMGLGQSSVCDQTMVRLLSIAEEHFTNQSTIDDAYVSDTKALGIIGGAQATTSIGASLLFNLFRFKTNHSFGTNSMHQFRVTNHDLSNELEFSILSSGQASTQLTLGFPMNFPSANTALSEFEDYLETRSNTKNRSMEVSIFFNRNDYSVTKCQVKHNMRSVSDGTQQTVVYTIQAQNQATYDALITGALYTILHPSQNMNILDLNNGTYSGFITNLFTSIYNLQSNSSSSVSVEYEVTRKQLSNATSFNVAIGLSALIGAKIGGNNGFEEGLQKVTEKGYWHRGRHYKTEKYSNSIPNLDITLQQLQQEVIDNLPTPLLQLFGTLYFLVLGRDREIHYIGDSGSYINLSQSNIPGGTGPISCTTWNWYGNDSSRSILDVPVSKRPLYESARRDREEFIGMEFGFGGFYQFEPLDVNLVGSCPLTLVYDDSELVGLNESSLAIYRENKDDLSWEYVGGIVDPVTNSVTANISRFGVYTLAPNQPMGTFVVHANPDSIVANGVSITNIYTSQIMQNTGAIVPNGALFTVATTNGEIIAIDQDPLTVGIQVAALNSVVTFQLRSSNVASKALVSIQSISGYAYGMKDVSFYDTQAPAMPIFISASGSDNSIILSWNSINEPDLAGYVISYDTDSPYPPFNGTATILGLPSPIVTQDSTYVIVGLTNGQSYYVTIQSFDSSGNLSQYCPPFLIIPTTTLANITGLECTVVTGQLKLSWNAVSNASSYAIYSSDNPYGNFEYLDSCGINEIYLPMDYQRKFFVIRASSKGVAFIPGK